MTLPCSQHHLRTRWFPASHPWAMLRGSIVPVPYRVRSTSCSWQTEWAFLERHSPGQNRNVFIANIQCWSSLSIFYENKFMSAAHWVEPFSLLTADTVVLPYPGGAFPALSPQILFQMSCCILPSNHLTLCQDSSPCLLILL